MIPTISLSSVPALLAHKAQGGRVFIPGGPVEPMALASAFIEQPEYAADLIFCGMMIPGINTTDWAGLHTAAQAVVFLPSPDLAATLATGRTSVLPLHYSRAYAYLCTAPFKAAIFHVCPPDRQGMCNLSLSADSAPAFFERAVYKIGLINHALPPILGAPSISVSMFDVLIEINEPPLVVAPSAPASATNAIAVHVAALIDNGATLQAGIGKLPGAVMTALAGHKGLKLHSGLIGDWALDLMQEGALAMEEGGMTAGVILGSSALHDALRDEVRISLVPINQTHGAANLARIENFTAINAALEIDLLGQINCEYVGRQSRAGVGGAVDFLRGARASRGGKPIIMIASAGKNGISRIVPRLNTPSVSIARTDAPILVTEHGSMDLELLDVHARAHAIIALASPEHRDALLAAWKDMAI